MGGCSSCCGVIVQSKSRRLVDQVYPEDIENVNPDRGGLKDLVEYAQENPDRLDRITTYLRDAALVDLQEKRYNRVLVSNAAMAALVRACSEHLTLFASQVIGLVEALIESEGPAIVRIAAVKTYWMFALASDAASGIEYYHHRWETFVDYFAAMCCMDSGPDALSTRVAGLLGLRAIICTPAVDILDRHLTDRLRTMLPAVLHNMRRTSAPAETNGSARGSAKSRSRRRQKRKEEIPDSTTDDLDAPMDSGDISLQEIRVDPAFSDDDGDLQDPGAWDLTAPPPDPHALAVGCFKDLARHGNTESLPQMMRTLFSIFDDDGGWLKDPSFATNCIRMAVSSSEGSFGWVPVSELLDHVVGKTTAVKTGIVGVLAEIVCAIHIPPDVSAVGEVVIGLRDQLCVSTQEYQAARGKARREHDRLQSAVIRATGVFGARIDTEGMKMEAIHQFVRNPEREDPVTLRGLLKCTLELARVMEHPPSQLDERLVGPLLKALQSDDDEIRLLVLEIFHELLSPAVQHPGVPISLKHPIGRLHKESAGIRFTKKYGSTLRHAIHEQLVNPSNTPAHFLNCFRIHQGLWRHVQNPGEMLGAALILQDAAVSLGDTAHARCLHQVVAAMVACVAAFFKERSFLAHLEQTLSARKAFGQLCPHLTLKLNFDAGTGPNLATSNFTDADYDGAEECDEVTERFSPETLAQFSKMTLEDLQSAATAAREDEASSTTSALPFFRNSQRLMSFPTTLSAVRRRQAEIPRSPPSSTTEIKALFDVHDLTTARLRQSNREATDEERRARPFVASAAAIAKKAHGRNARRNRVPGPDPIAFLDHEESQSLLDSGLFRAPTKLPRLSAIDLQWGVPHRTSVR